MCLCVRCWLYEPILALNCRLQIEQVNSDCAESDDGSLALAFLSLRYIIYEPRREKNNVLVADQVRHKPSCAAKEYG